MGESLVFRTLEQLFPGLTNHEGLVGARVRPVRAHLQMFS